MSQADILLNTLPDGVGYTVEPETERYFVIDNDRKIIVPDELKRLAVQYDHDIETVTFDCPRYWDGHDMSVMQVFINYLLPNGEDGFYIVKDVSAEGDRMYFDWTISRDITTYKGNISFLVCVKKTDAEGDLEKHWNSELCRDCYISEGMECSETILEKYPDVITDLLTRMSTVEDIAVTFEEMEKAAAEADYAMGETVAMTRMVAEDTRYVRNAVKTLGDSFANPIKRKKATIDAIIKSEDVSPVEHTAHVKVAGKNLLKPEIKENITGVEWTNVWQCTADVENDGKIVLTSAVGTTSGVAYARVGVVTLKKGKTYVCTRIDPINVSQVLCWYPETTNIAWNTNNPITPANDITVELAVYMKDISSVGNVTSIYLQVEENTSTNYTPYVDPSTVTLTTCGANLVDIPDTTIERSNSWGYKALGDFELPSGTYTARLNFLQEGDVTHVAVSARKYGIAEVMYANKSSNDAKGELVMTFTIPEGETGVTLYAYSNNTADVLNTKCTFSDIRVEAGSTAGEYEPYKGVTYTPSEDGTVDISAVYPIMTLYADANVSIDVEYNRDINVLISDIDTVLTSIMSRLTYLESLH